GCLTTRAEERHHVGKSLLFLFAVAPIQQRFDARFHGLPDFILGHAQYPLCIAIMLATMPTMALADALDCGGFPAGSEPATPGRRPCLTSFSIMIHWACGNWRSVYIISSRITLIYSWFVCPPMVGSHVAERGPMLRWLSHAFWLHLNAS